ncbi:hypothetical protein F5B19DRAFT_459431 [Rostrohypoxylon terebratum]|nr:hypothetical protein F5B19DRAFT_459431 [Rostrohypoxylon terebratum]
MACRIRIHGSVRVCRIRMIWALSLVQSWLTTNSIDPSARFFFSFTWVVSFENRASHPKQTQDINLADSLSKHQSTSDYSEGKHRRIRPWGRTPQGLSLIRVHEIKLPFAT